MCIHPQGFWEAPNKFSHNYRGIHNAFRDNMSIY